MAKRNYHRKIYQKNKNIKRFSKALTFFSFIVAGLMLSGFAVFIYYAKDLPRPEKFTEKSLIQPTKIYDRTGEILLSEIYGEEKRDVISLEQTSKHLIGAVVATEDANFYSHFGVDFRGIARALLVNIKLRKPVQGGSTISQQLVRSSFLTMERSAKRKIREIILTLELERRYSKNQILEWYLNQVPFGINIYGAERASQTYFQKPCQELSLPQAAILASLIQAPSYLSPYGKHEDELLIRKNYVLDRMAKENFISEEECEEAKNEKIEFAEPIQMKAPHFIFFVKNYLLEKYGREFLEEEGFKIYTTIDWELQELAENIIKEQGEANQVYNAYNASLVAIEPETGQILSMVGSKDYFSDPYPSDCVSGKNCMFDPEVNISTYNQGRQPGSAFKPFAYAAAFKKGFSPETALWDVETNFGVWGAQSYIPQNYDKKFRGPISLRSALAQSINIPSVKTFYLAGQTETIQLAKSFGITTLNRGSNFYGLSLVLGGGEVKLLDMTSAYGIFATEGLKVPPMSILKIEDSKGNIIEERKITPQRVIETEVCRLINDVLSDNEARAPMFGKKSSLYFENYEVAGKTGTVSTKDGKVIDAWIIGYTPAVSIGVWVGNNNNAPMAEKPAVTLAGPIWHKFMDEALLKYPKKNFVEPKPILTEKPVLNGKIDLQNPHSILYYIDKNNPLGEEPENPQSDSQYNKWEEGIKKWIELHYPLLIKEEN